MSIWSNAFKINKGRQLSEDEKDFILRAAIKIKKRKMEDIAIFALEATTPIHTIASNIMYFIEPTLGFIFSKQELTKLSSIIENPKGIEYLKQQLEGGKNE
ncbi:MAG: hypothetical protein K6357_07445 [Elusimicrobiota bacterium]